jgi:hypothetical protein
VEQKSWIPPLIHWGEAVAVRVSSKTRRLVSSRMNQEVNASGAKSSKDENESRRYRCK